MATSPENIKTIDYNGNQITILKMDNIPDYDMEDYDLNDDKDRVKYFKDIEKIIRGSFEYRELISYFREYMDMNKCSFFENVNNIESFGIKIHLHHTPLNLYEIVCIVFSKRQYYKEDLDPEAIAKEVMYLHYSLLVGLIPLCETVHELVHSSYIFIPNSAVMGNYQTFIDMYKEFIPEDILSKLHTIEECSLLYDNSDNMNILKTNYIYLDTSGAYNFPKTSDILSQLDNRMQELRDNNFDMDIVNTEPEPKRISMITIL